MRRLARVGRSRPDFVLAAAGLFGLAEVLAAAISGRPFTYPFRLSASVALGRRALDATPAGVAIVVGLLVALVLASFWGAIYGAVASRLPEELQTSRVAQAAGGVILGTVVYLVHFQLLARLAWPWFLEVPQGVQLLLHTSFFGLPLGLLYTQLEKEAPVRR